MGCHISVEEATSFAVNELGIDEADFQGWQQKNNHIECLGLVSKTFITICSKHSFLKTARVIFKAMRTLNSNRSKCTCEYSPDRPKGF